MSRYDILREADLPLEVVILLTVGMMMLLTGMFLFPISSQTLPYYENGLYGLLLVTMALQIITLGKTPLAIYSLPHITCKTPASITFSIVFFHTTFDIIWQQIVN